MLSTFARHAAPLRPSCLRPVILVRQSSTLPATSAAKETHPYENEFLLEDREVTLEQRVQYWKEANEIFYGPQRDMKNYPPLELPETIEKDTHMFIIPASFFRTMYDRLGVSGCYSLVWGSFLFMMNKEFLILPNAAFGDAIFGITFFLVFFPKFGKKIGMTFDKWRQEILDYDYVQPLKEAKEEYLVELDNLKTGISNQEAVPVLYDAKKEQVDLLLEVQYRERLADVFDQVTKRLDYQASVEEAKRKFEEDLMLNWITDNVEKGLTPQLEKENLAVCIKNLESLSKSATL